MAGELAPESIDAINAALFAGRWIDAIKIYRTATGAGLKESKDFIEALEVRLRAETPERFTVPPRKQSSGVGCVMFLLLVAVGIAVVVMLFY